MQLIKYISKLKAYGAGILVLLCLIGCVSFKCAGEQDNRIARFACRPAETKATEGFKKHSSAQRSANNKGHSHFSHRNNFKTKLLVKKPSAELFSVQPLYPAKFATGATIARPGIIARPGYYIFLFRCALF